MHESLKIDKSFHELRDAFGKALYLYYSSHLTFFKYNYDKGK